MTADKNIYLIGPRACGKTSVGQALAKRLGRDFLDMDFALVDFAGMEIADYVAEHGWDGFRDMEAEVLRREAENRGRVISCGGGIILRPENREVLTTGVTLYLSASAEELARRLSADPKEGQRPSLTGKSIVDEVRDVLQARRELYEQCAEVVITGATLEEAVEKSEAAVRSLLAAF